MLVTSSRSRCSGQVYAYFSVYISVAFFPSESHAVSVMLALGTFALSFFIRPVGAIVLGSFADR